MSNGCNEARSGEPAHTMSRSRPNRANRTLVKAVGCVAAVWLAAVWGALVAAPSVTPTKSASESLRTEAPANAAAAGEPLHAIPAPPAGDPRVIALGQALFADRRLSANNTMSCLSCHDIATNGATSRTVDQPLNGSGSGRNTPTVFNAALNFRLNWTGDARTLQGQAEASMRVAMGQTVEAATATLSTDADTVAKFKEAFGRGPDPATILDAIAAYEETLLTPQSAFDRWLQGDPDALPRDARQGYQRFKALGCISCHQGVNVGGNLFQPSGVYGVLTDPSRPVLRVPSLRNIATTAPYFHDGSTPTLSDAVRMMARAQLDRVVSDQDVSDIVAFLTSLTGQYRGHTLAAPEGLH